ncbi:MAG: transglycosylase SLT domain-containing protein, partial [Blastocatellia bacterium]
VIMVTNGESDLSASRHTDGASNGPSRRFQGLTWQRMVLVLGLCGGLAGWGEAQEVPRRMAAGSTAAAQDDPSSVVRRLIETSTHHFQRAEAAWRAGQLEQARRDYDRALDLVLESGIDIRTSPALRQHYLYLVEQTYQRQLALTASSGQEDGATRGFGQQVFTPSPLDELTKLDLTKEELSSATPDQARSTVQAAHLDFTFQPNSLIQGFLNYYMGRGRSTMESGLRRSGRFIEMARRIFREEGVPQDLVWLGQVESAWSPVARSWAAAVGLWQFIPGTAARFGLYQDAFIDERCSFEKATRASARYLKFLGDRYNGNWELAMAAYNCGEHRVDRGIERLGSPDFWELYSRGLLPRETRNYVPNILATILIAKNPARFGFEVVPEPALHYDLVPADGLVDLRLVADATDTSHDLMLALNPELKQGMTPPSIEYQIRVPPGKGALLEEAFGRIPPDKRASWRMVTAKAGDTFETIARRAQVDVEAVAQVNGESLLPGQKVIVPLPETRRNVVLTSAASDTGKSSRSITSRSSKTKVRTIQYRVKRGDTVGELAGRYRTSVREITTINKLRSSSRLRVGQTLQIPVRGVR